MKTSSAKAKGRRCAQEVKDIILSVFPQLESDDVTLASAGQTGEDILLSPQARSLLPISSECKNVEALNIWKALAQAEGNRGDYIPVVFFRRNRSKLYVALDADVLINLFKGQK